MRLYAEDDFAARPVFTDPEILRSSLAAVILPTATNGNTIGGGPYATPGVFAPALFIQFAGFTFGKLHF